MRFALIDGAKAEFPVHRLCRVLSVSQSGYFAWRGRLVCRRQRDDMVLLAHVRSAFALSNGTPLSGCILISSNGSKPMPRVAGLVRAVLTRLVFVEPDGYRLEACCGPG